MHIPTTNNPFLRIPFEAKIFLPPLLHSAEEMHVDHSWMPIKPYTYLHDAHSTVCFYDY